MILSSKGNLRKLIFEAASNTLKTATGTVFTDDRSAEQLLVRSRQNVCHFGGCLLGHRAGIPSQHLAGRDL
jgi:hypothetical protein